MPDTVRRTKTCAERRGELAIEWDRRQKAEQERDQAVAGRQEAEERRQEALAVNRR